MSDGVLFKGRLEEGNYNLIKTTDGWVLDGKDIAFAGSDITDRPQGEWIGYEVPSECSVCGHCWDEYVLGQDIWYDGSVPNFCPNCGCRMKGADE